MRIRRLALFAAALLSGLTLGLPVPRAIAAEPEASCGKPELRAEGRHSDPGTPDKKENSARKLSIDKWEQLAKEMHGPQFASWQLARARRIDCEHYDQPGFNGRVSCVAIGLPCDRR